MNKNKILVIGLDGATFDVILPLTEEGELLNIKKLMDEGAWGKLKSTIPRLTPPAWTSAVTGVNPGKHGIFNFTKIRKDTYEYDLIQSTHRKTPAIWNILSNHEKKVGMINIPVTYPPEKVNGFMITGMLTPSEKHEFTYPKRMKKELFENVKNYEIDVKSLYEERNLDKYYKEILKITEMRAEAIEYFLKEKEWDFFMAVFIGIDKVQHFFWKYMDKNHARHKPSKYENVISDYMQKLDGYIEEFIHLCDENTTIILISDHGFQKLEKYILINVWLQENGFLKMKKPRGILQEFMLKLGISQESILSFLKKFGIKRFDFIPKKIRSLPPEKYIFKLKIDMRKTRAYWLSGGDLSIRINLKGREPQGTVRMEKEYEDLRDEIIRKLYDLKDPETGEKVIDKIYKKEEIYEGLFIDAAQDILVIPKVTYSVRPWYGEKVIIPSVANEVDRSGTHSQNGIFIAKGKDILSGAKTEDAEIVDVVPTILHIMDVPIPDNIDGRVLKEIFRKDSALYHKEIKIQKSEELTREEFEFSRKDEEQIKERLKGLGYLE